MIGKSGAANRNDGLRSKPRSNLNALASRPKICANSVNMLKHLLAITPTERLNQPLKHITPQDANIGESVTLDVVTGAFIKVKYRN